MAVGHLQAGGFAERTGDISIGDILNAFVDDKNALTYANEFRQKVYNKSNCRETTYDRVVVRISKRASRCKRV